MGNDLTWYLAGCIEEYKQEGLYKQATSDYYSSFH